jgi:hypothetical protein
MNAIQNIVEWNKSRNLLNYNPTSEYNTLASELNEYVTSLINGADPVDDLADIIVVAIGTLFKLGYDPEKVLLEVHKEISSRKGAINPNTGKWEKDPNQDLRNRYTANYTTCRIT